MHTTQSFKKVTYSLRNPMALALALISIVNLPQVPLPVVPQPTGTDPQMSVSSPSAAPQTVKLNLGVKKRYITGILNIVQNM